MNTESIVAGIDEAIPLVIFNEEKKSTYSLIFIFIGIILSFLFCSI